LALALTATDPGSMSAVAAKGQLTWALPFSSAPGWFDPAEAPGLITPYVAPYAQHVTLQASSSRRGIVMQFITRQLARMRDALLLMLVAVAAPAPAVAGSSQGQLTWGVHISLAPTWFDPAETPGFLTPYMVLYALHDALLKPMPKEPLAPSLAESWTGSEDGLTYEFVLRNGVKFHNGDAMTAEDVKFSFERYRGAAHAMLKEHVAEIETPDPQRVRFRLKQPWPDFLTFYVRATGADWIVPKKYVEQVGDEGFKKAPVGAGPYKFVSFTPGQELVLEAFDGYWRKTPSVKRLVLRGIPDETTRLAALERGEIDIAYSFHAELAEELQRSKGFAVKAPVIDVPLWLYFPEQWEPKSPWHDERVRRAASLAIDTETINQATLLGHGRITGSIIPDDFEFYWALPPPTYDPVKAKTLLAEAGYPSGLDAGDFYCDSSFAPYGEAIADNLQAVGIRSRLRPLERAAFFKGYAEKSFKNIVMASSGAFGNAATRLESFVVKGGPFVYGSYPDLDALFAEQAAELDRGRREAILHKMQQLVHQRTIYAPIFQIALISGVGPRVGESGLGLLAGHPYSTPYEDLTLAGKAK
jgi:peptide/nickel transport system substrate-binding protein